MPMVRAADIQTGDHIGSLEVIATFRNATDDCIAIRVLTKSGRFGQRLHTPDEMIDVNPRLSKAAPARRGRRQKRTV